MGRLHWTPAAPTPQPGLAVLGAVPSSFKLTVSTHKSFQQPLPLPAFLEEPRKSFPSDEGGGLHETVAFPDSCSLTFLSQGTELPVIYSDILFPDFIALFYMVGEVRAFVI